MARQSSGALEGEACHAGAVRKHEVGAAAVEHIPQRSVERRCIEQDVRQGAARGKRLHGSRKSSQPRCSRHHGGGRRHVTQVVNMGRFLAIVDE